MEEFKDIKVGFIGCGNIAHFHADVLKHLGAQIQCVAYKKNKDRAEKFSDKYNINKIYNNWEEMLNSEKVDCLWVAARWHKGDKVLSPIMSYGIPTFFEKPVALSSSQINEAIERYPQMIHKVQVGYNRRFYPFMKKLKDDLKRENIVNIELNIPELLIGNDVTLREDILFQNSSHIFDLLYYLIDEDYSLINIRKLEAKEHIGYSGFLLSNSGIPITLSAVWNSPSNFRIKFYTQLNKIYDLCPIEVLNIYEGMEKVEPTIEFPLRQYYPNRIEQHIAMTDKRFKPGFLQQTKYFFEKALTGHSLADSATLKSAYFITQLIERIVNLNAR